MRFLILTLGTRGDLELFLSLAEALAARGHAVTLASSALHADRVAESGLAFAEVGTSTLADATAGLRAAGGTSDLVERTRRVFTGWLQAELQTALQNVGPLVSAHDGFISNLKLVLQRGGRVIPTVSVTYDPPLRLDDLPRYGPARAEVLDLVALNRRLIDPHNQWDPRYRFTGFWGSQPRVAGEMSPELEAFLAAGPPPVVMTLGSMAFSDLDSIQAVFAEALRQVGQRGVLVRGWSEGVPPAPDERLILVDEAPYEALFARSAAVVHHGGVGTLAAVLRAGLPSVILPQVACQQVLAESLAREQLSAGTLLPNELCAELLGTLIHAAIHSQNYSTAARNWKQILNADGGVGQAAQLCEVHLSRLLAP